MLSLVVSLYLSLYTCRNKHTHTLSRTQPGTWRDLTPAEKAERERKRLAVQKIKEEARKRKQLMQEAEDLKRQIEATEQRRAKEKKMSVAARLEEIRNAVGATADTLWE